MKSPSPSESSSSSAAKGLRFFGLSALLGSCPLDVFVSEFCLLCRASLAASWRRAREGGILRGGGGGGGADGGSSSAEEVAVVVDGLDM